MKVILERHTGLEEQTIIEIQHQAKVDGEYREPDVLELRELCRRAWEVIDDRVRANNAKIVAAKDMMRQIEDKKYRVMFLQFLDEFLGISSQALPLHAQTRQRDRKLEDPDPEEEVPRGRR